MKRYQVCPISPGNLWWEAFGQNSHLQNVAGPVAGFATEKGARNYAQRHANDYNHGLAVVDYREELVDWGGSQMAVWEKPGADEDQ